MSEFYPMDASLPCLSVEENNADNEYTLNQDTVWITVNNLSLYIRKNDEGVSVDIFPVGFESEDPIAGTWATYAEVDAGRPA